jgi:hypothetical protein
MWGNTVAIHSALKKKTIKLNSQPTQYQKNKINKHNSKKKKNRKKNEKKKKTILGKKKAKKLVGEVKAKFSISSILKSSRKIL